MTFYFNNRDSFEEEKIFSDNRTDGYGVGDYGSGTYGGEYDDYFWEVKPRQHRCTSISIKLEDYYSDNTPSGGFDISAITFEIGAKKGRYKQQKRQRAAKNS